MITNLTGNVSIIDTMSNKSYLETNPSLPMCVVFKCECGNKLIVPEALVELGLTDSCGHCNQDFSSRLNHEEAILENYKQLIEGETVVEL